MQSFSWVGEHDEARRVSDSLTYMVDIAEGRIDDAIKSTQRKLALDPNNQGVIVTAADVLHFAGRFDEARPLYERLLEFLPVGRPINNAPNATIRMALSRRKTGDELGAQAAIEIVKKDIEKRYSAGANNQFLRRADAMLSAYDNDPDAALAALASALNFGLRDPLFFDEPVFEVMRDDSRFTALREELDGIRREQAEAEDARQERIGTCPGGCEGKLIQEAFRDILIDRCPTCNGVWLDPGELEKISYDDAAVVRSVWNFFSGRSD